MSQDAPARRWRVSRRGFLLGLGATTAAVAVGIAAGRAPLRLLIAEQLAGGSGPPGNFPADPWAWYEITADNRVRLFVTKVEMGQGIHTALAQIGAEELGVAWERLEVVQVGTGHALQDASGTAASNSVSSSFRPMREAAAMLREMLRLRAAATLGVPAAGLVLVDGAFRDPAGGERVDFGTLVAMSRPWEEPEGTIPLKRPDEFEIIGRSLPRVDLPAKIRGEAVYGYDMRLPGMLYGAVLRPPTVDARLRAVRPGDAPNRPGVVQVVIDGEFAGVVAESRSQAWAALAALDAEWDEGRRWQQDDLEALVQVPEAGGVVIQREGDALDPAGTVTVTGDYRTPLAVHAHLEPQAALADASGDRIRIWASTQSAAAVRGDVADVLGVPEEDVEVVPTYLGGGFGRKINIEAAREAARLSRAVGRPVHVGWSRAEDLRHGYFRPPTHSVLSARLDGGRIAALEHRLASGDVAFPWFPPFLRAVMGADFAAWRGARIAYGAIPARRAAISRLELPVRTGWWRGLGLLANTFAIESFMDDLAHRAGADPLAFRLAHLDDSEAGRRMAGVLQAAAEAAGYGQPLSPDRALGIACAEDYGTAVAEVAEVSVDRTTGRLQVHRVVAAMDPGLVINPDGATAQVQGAINMGLSATLLEEVRLRDGRVEMANFDGYPLLTIADSPAVEVILRQSGGDPTGVGEPPIGPIAAAVGNAVFNLTGARLRRLPFTPTNVLAALSGL